MAEKETKNEAEAEVRAEGTKHYDDEEDKVLTVKIDLRGPIGMLSWMNPFNARRRIMEMLPPGAREHMATAQKEQLLAMRSIVDSVLDNMIDRVERADTKGPRKATKVEVE